MEFYAKIDALKDKLASLEKNYKAAANLMGRIQRSSKGSKILERAINATLDEEALSDKSK